MASSKSKLFLLNLWAGPLRRAFLFTAATVKLVEVLRELWVGLMWVLPLDLEEGFEEDECWCCAEEIDDCMLGFVIPFGLCDSFGAGVRWGDNGFNRLMIESFCKQNHLLSTDTSKVRKLPSSTSNYLFVRAQNISNFLFLNHFLSITLNLDNCNMQVRENWNEFSISDIKNKSCQKYARKQKLLGKQSCNSWVGTARKKWHCITKISVAIRNLDFHKIGILR